ncbi:hypothetical protein [Beggiatoa leptomitoformis]|uniref:Uncharacterized protein n=1 Tax=Beggiatoa leptomitoformis TaxID=288004 RepID=A0A2N9YB60_9GAMM|nr:hypothetical protein [Beggiatoa leptomitoformis]AUI67684.1 hypothetical protein BLE401_02550 [Beggiatoa leptomitoformis]QGX03520.1 hypothetical protein AL038_18435 [Beggiatoa leptomitoformis]
MNAETLEIKPETAVLATDNVLPETVESPNIPPDTQAVTATKSNPPNKVSVEEASEATAHMIRYIDEANLLITYASKKGLDIDENVISTVVSAKYWLKKREWTAEREVLFWHAFNAIAKAVYPVSVSSLRACGVFNEEELQALEQIKSKSSKLSLVNIQDSEAKRTVKVYQAGSLFILFILLFVQVYWLMASMRVSPVVKLSTQIEAIIAELDSIKQRVPIEQWSVDREINNLNAQLEDLRNRLMANYEILKNSSSWSVFIFNSDTANNTTETTATTDTTTSTASTASTDSVIQTNTRALFQQTTDQGELFLSPTILQPATSSTISSYTPETAMRMDILLQERQFILRALQLYLLPVLYGLLGASAYVLRVLTVEIRELTYVKESNISYRLRIQLGALSGLAIGWFTEPNVASFSALSPLALAFLAGYSVELLFALMDKVIGAFSNSTETPRKH